MRRITCEDLALGFACKRILEAETDGEVLEEALATRATSTRPRTSTASGCAR